ncbi:MAG: hypothetical protein IKQ18_04055 [Clostridia bacterium]|nr:hypothetical protein [Clostridia bacterium]
MASFLDTKDTTNEFEAEDIAQNRAMGILAYIGILVLVPIFAAKGSKWARWHANRGLVLLIAEFAVCFTLGLLALIPYVGWIFWILESLCSLAFCGLIVFGIITAAKGKAKAFPLVGALFEKITILK